MKIVKVAKTAGFCFGVEKAVGKVYETIHQQPKGKPLYTFGPIIHNEYVTEDLKSKGIQTIEEKSQIGSTQKGTVVIRSHGVDQNTYLALESSGHEIKDATCPFVLKIHRIVEEYSQNGYDIIIVGNSKHPEVEGIMGWSHSPCICINSLDEATSIQLDQNKKFCVVAQTTFNKNKFQYIVEILQEKGYDISVLDTVCNATRARQKEAKSLAKEVDAMIVIGGKNSSNTQKLFEICKSECQNTYYIQSVNDLDLLALQSIDSVGITAGASTPKNLIEEVQRECQNLVLNNC